MMNDRKIIYPVCFLMTVMGCKVTDQGSVTDKYRYVNESGVEVALVGNAIPYFGIPDSLVLQNGDTFECSIKYPEMDAGIFPGYPYYLGGPTTDPSSAYIPVKIYYNKNTCIVYTHKDYTERNPIFVEQSSLTKKRHSKIYTYTYTFTAEDYQNAIKAQK